MVLRIAFTPEFANAGEAARALLERARDVAVREGLSSASAALDQSLDQRASIVDAFGQAQYQVTLKGDADRDTSDLPKHFFAFTKAT
jgi:hypothetical protein